MTASDYLYKAFLLAKRANSFDIRPNPFVGAIIVDQNGEIIGEGYHKKAGEAHAEVYAIKDAKQKNNDLSKCTLYVTLEPCSHFGKTPPCTELILEEKIEKVVIGSMDPNPLVSGAKLLKDAGVKIEICLIPEIENMNSCFIINQQLKRPKYILKSATTINGKIADRYGNSKWLSNAKSRNYVHEKLRANADAILTTAKTVIKDNATLNIRLDKKNTRELNVIIIDKELEILKEEHKFLNIFYKRNKSKIYLISNKTSDKALPAYVEIIHVQLIEENFNLTELSEKLLKKNLCQILVEGGGKLNASLLKEKLIDELYQFICPSLLADNNALNVINAADIQKIENKIQLSLINTILFDEDVLLNYRLTY